MSRLAAAERQGAALKAELDASKLAAEAKPPQADAAPQGTPPPPEGATKGAAADAEDAAEQPTAAPTPPVAVGSMQRVRELQQQCFAEDIALTEEMAAWDEARLVRFFEAGGK